MSTQRSYTCNLCRASIRDIDGTASPARRGIGIKWGAGLGEEMERKECFEAETHLCMTCLMQLKVLISSGLGDIKI